MRRHLRSHSLRIRNPFHHLVLEPLEVRIAPASINLQNVPTWVAQGPGPISGGQSDSITVTGTPAVSDPVSGAVTAIAIRPNDSKVVYIGTTNGGVWKTDDITIARPVWSTNTDQFSSLAV